MTCRTTRPTPTLHSTLKTFSYGDRGNINKVDLEEDLLLVKGSVPGSKKSIVSVNLSFKKVFKSLDEKKATVKHKVNPMKQSKAKAGAAKKKGK
jgi:hypothetical protein